MQIQESTYVSPIVRLFLIPPLPIGERDRVKRIASYYE
jgi:hypothetical protein